MRRRKAADIKFNNPHLTGGELGSGCCGELWLRKRDPDALLCFLLCVASPLMYSHIAAWNCRRQDGFFAIS